MLATKAWVHTHQQNEIKTAEEIHQGFHWCAWIQRHTRFGTSLSNGIQGAVEVWIVTEQGAWQVIDAHGEQPATRYPITL